MTAIVPIWIHADAELRAPSAFKIEIPLTHWIFLDLSRIRARTLHYYSGNLNVISSTDPITDFIIGLLGYGWLFQPDMTNSSSPGGL